MRPASRMTALLAALIGGVLLGSADAGHAAGEPRSDPIQLQADKAILIEASSGSILFEKNADVPAEPASLSKLMTAEVIFNELKAGNIKLDDEYPISEHAWRTGGAPSGGSAMFAPIHSRVRVEDLLQGAIVQSGNDACIALAEGIAGNQANFARLMNDRAQEIGLTKSSFANPTGLHDPAQKMTARDLATLARHIIRTYPEYYHFYGQREFTWNKIRQFNRNPLLNLDMGVDGLKTGYIKESGYGLVASAVQNGTRLIAVVMGAKTEKERADEGKKLLDWGYRAFEAKLLFAEGQPVGEAKVFGGEVGRVPLLAAGPVRLMMPKTNPERLTARIVYKGPVRAPVRQGDPVGVLRVWRGDQKQVALEVPLAAASDVGTGTTTQRAVDAAMEWVISVFQAGARSL